jgi:hypothetical protein
MQDGLGSGDNVWSAYIVESLVSGFEDYCVHSS